MRFDAIFATSAPVRTDDLDWEAAGRAGLTDGELFALSYFADVEGQTVFYLRDLLTSGLADDPDVLRFLTVWSYEEHFHGEAIAKLLDACGRPVDAGRGRAIRRAARLAERLQAAAASLGTRPEDATRLLRILFPGGPGPAEEIDRRIAALPGLGGLRMVQDFFEQAALRASRSACPATPAGVAAPLYASNTRCP